MVHVVSVLRPEGNRAPKFDTTEIVFHPLMSRHQLKRCGMDRTSDRPKEKAAIKNLAWNAAEPVSLDRNGPRDVAFRRFEPEWVERPALELFAEVAARYPDNIACEDVDTRLTFAEVWQAARRLAATIHAAAPTGKPVGVLLPNQASFGVAVLACLGAGRPCVLIDRNYPQDRVGSIVRAAGLAAVVLGRADIDAGYLLPAGVLALELESALMAGPAPAGMPTAAPLPDVPSFIVYTSGSTGAPKGIVLSQRSVLHRAAELVNAVHLRPDDKVLSLASPGTIGGLQQIFEVMLSGASLVKLDLQRLGLGQIVRTIAERRISMMFSTPAVWRSVARLEGARAALSSLRCIQSSGDTLLRVDCDLVRSVLPTDCHILSVYGATEAPALLQWFVADAPADEARVPAGYPLPDIDFAVLDEHGVSVSDGEPGEFVIRSRFTSSGLWQNGIVDPGPFEIEAQAPQSKIFRTGDLVRRRPDGLYVVLGRQDRQVKVLGNRVELAEIETVLRRMPNIVDAAVIARRGDSEPLLLAFVVPRSPAGPEILSEVRRHLGATLPAYMRPRRLVALDSLPLLPGRKIDEEALLTLAGRSDDAPDAPARPAAGSNTLRMVDTAWRRALGRSAPNRQLSFEESGGDSLQLLHLVFELERLAERPLPMERFHTRLNGEQMALELELCLGEAPIALATDSPALFLFPPGGGADAHLAALRTACALHLPVRQVAYPDLGVIARADASFEDIAAHAVRMISLLKPNGPLVLVGYSDGGDVAYEAARQLRACGREVARLLLLDTDASGLSYPAPPTERRSLRSRMRDFGRKPRVHRLRQLVDFFYPEKILRGSYGRFLVRCALALPIALPRDIAFIVSFKTFQLLFDVLHLRWSADLKAAPLDVPFVLFRSDENRPGALDDLGWRPRTTNLTIEPVPGDHSTVLVDERLAARVAQLAGASAAG
jgi:acyl-coenzyme A synthetase/AMP-(fatty) acid ligase/thioesterase domain-containing protein